MNVAQLLVMSAAVLTATHGRGKSADLLPLRGEMRAKTEAAREELPHLSERDCPDCKGTSVEIMKQPTRPAIRIYPARFKMPWQGKTRQLKT